MATKPVNDPRPFLRVRVEVKDRDRLKVIAAKAKLTTQEMLTEALNDWLEKNGHRKLTEQK